MAHLASANALLRLTALIHIDFEPICMELRGTIAITLPNTPQAFTDVSQPRDQSINCREHRRI